MPYADPVKQRRAQAKWGRDNRSTTNKHRTKARRSARDKIIILKESTPCTDCQVKYPYYVMQFDHRPGESKLGCVATMVGKNASWLSVEKEIAKCDLVCANCHAKRTHARQYGRDPAG